ncbi:MAG: universal stress protein [Bacteroidia bacterium]|nr:universal stress protein [Bacteroidia bacterium]
MKKILFPTDFSPAAENAFAYALHLATHLEADIHLLHCYDVAGAEHALLPAELWNALRTAEEAQALEVVRRYEAQVQARTGTRITIVPILRVGFAAEVIRETALSLMPDMVVMGTKGASDRLDALIGSITSQVAQGLPVPLLAVPAYARFDGIRRMIYATDLLQKDAAVSARLGALAHILGTALDCVHVVSDASQVPSFAESAYLRSMYQADTQVDELELYVIHAEHVWDGLADHLALKPAELVAVAAPQHGFVERVFHHSVTRELTLYAEVPVLVFPV